jgi:RNA polymerase I-specific transcription initiation factor RRN3
MQFARVAHATDFIYCYSILESNKRLDYANSQPKPSPPGPVSVTINPAALGASVTTELNTFFPFDPYKLPKSGSYIQSVYREWSTVAIDDDDDEDDEEGDCDGVREGCYDYMDIPSSKSTRQEDSDADGLGASFDGMSISPMRPALVAAMS